MNKTCPYSYTTERYGNNMCYVHSNIQWENVTAVQLDKKLSESLKPSGTSPYSLQPAINTYDEPVESRHSYQILSHEDKIQPHPSKQSINITTNKSGNRIY
jgi:hypothetical protein